MKWVIVLELPKSYKNLLFSKHNTLCSPVKAQSLTEGITSMPKLTSPDDSDVTDSPLSKSEYASEFTAAAC